MSTESSEALMKGAVMGAFLGVFAALLAVSLVAGIFWRWNRDRTVVRSLADHKGLLDGSRRSHGSAESVASYTSYIPNPEEGRILLSVLRTTFDPARIGTITRHGVAPVKVSRLQRALPDALRTAPTSKAKINQDRGLVCYPFRGSSDRALICVFDGHGSQGEHIAEFCIHSVLERLQSSASGPPRSGLGPDAAASLREAIVAANEDLLSHPELGSIAATAGCTAHLMYLNGPDVTVASVGDSRATLGKRHNGAITAVDLSTDHTPDLPDEQQRIEAAGGVVTPAGPGGFPPARVCAAGRKRGGLAMSRAIGDGDLKPFGVTAEPEVRRLRLSFAPLEMTHTQGESRLLGGDGEAGTLHSSLAASPVASECGSAADGDAFIIIASDGIWEFGACTIEARRGPSCGHSA